MAEIKGFTVKEVVEPRTGKIHRIYKYDGRECRRVILKTRLSSHMSGYSLIEKDLRNCLAWLGEIKAIYERQGLDINAAFCGNGDDRKVFNVIKGLYVACLTFYGKCFTSCKGRPVKLEENQLDEKFRKLHSRCMTYRHNFAAHSGEGRIEYADVAIVFPAKPRKKEPIVPVKMYMEITQPDLELPVGKDKDDVTLESLLKHVQEIARKKIDFLSKKIQEEELSKGHEYWSRQ